MPRPWSSAQDHEQGTRPKRERQRDHHGAEQHPLWQCEGEDCSGKRRGLQYAWRSFCRRCGKVKTSPPSVIALEDGCVSSGAVVIGPECEYAAECDGAELVQLSCGARLIVPEFEVWPSEEYEVKLAQRVYSQENRVLRRARWQVEAQLRRAARMHLADVEDEMSVEAASWL